MSTCNGVIEFFTGSMADTHDLRVVITQEFDEEPEDHFVDLRERSAPEVAVYTGDMLLWTGKPAEMSGWLGVAVKVKIKAGKWEFQKPAVEVVF